MRFPLLLLFLLAGCAAPAPVPAPAAPTPETAPAEKREILLAPEETRTIEMEENATTGYSWSARSSDPAVTVTITHLPPAAHTGLCGAPGKAQFTLKAMPEFRKGTATVTLEYARPWEKGVPPIQTVRFTIRPKTAD